MSRGVIIALAASSIGMLAGGTFGNAAATYRWGRKYGVSAEGSGLAGTLPTIFNNATLMLLSIAGMLHQAVGYRDKQTNNLGVYITPKGQRVSP
ncbi:MAG: hypothetical protein ACP5N0_01265 [Methanosarcina sp.]